MTWQSRDVDNSADTKVNLPEATSDLSGIQNALLPILINNVGYNFPVDQIRHLYGEVLDVRDSRPDISGVRVGSDAAALWLKTVGLGNDGILYEVKEVVKNPAHRAEAQWDAYNNANFDGVFTAPPPSERWRDGHFFYNSSNHTWYRFRLNSLTNAVDIEVVTDETSVLGSDAVWLGSFASPAQASAAVSGFDTNKKYYMENLGVLFVMLNDSYTAATSADLGLEWVPSTQALHQFIGDFRRILKLTENSIDALERKAADLHETTGETWTTITAERLISYPEGSSTAAALYQGTIPSTTQWHNKLSGGALPYNIVVRLELDEEPSDYRLWAEGSTEERERSIRLDSWKEYARGATYKYLADPSETLDAGSFVLQYHGAAFHTEVDAPLTERAVRASNIYLKSEIDARSGVTRFETIEKNGIKGVPTKGDFEGPYVLYVRAGPGLSAVRKVDINFGGIEVASDVAWQDDELLVPFSINSTQADALDTNLSGSATSVRVQVRFYEADDTLVDRVDIDFGIGAAYSAPTTATSGLNQAQVDARAEIAARDRYTDAEKGKVANLPDETHQTLTSAATITWDIDDGAVADLTLGHNVTLTLSNGENGQTAMLRTRQDTTGSRTLTLASTIQRGGRDAPVLNTSVNKRDYLLFTNIAGTWYYLGIIADA